MYAACIIMRTEAPTWIKTAKVLVVAFGVAMTGYGDLAFNLAGVLLQLGSIIMDSFRCCLLQRVMQSNQLQVGPLVTLAHVAPFTMAALLLPMAIWEGPMLVQEYSQWSPGAGLVIFSGLLAASLNFAVFKVIDLTSALTSSLSGVLKDWACMLISIYLHNTIVTGLQWAGYGVAVGGLAW